MTAKRREISPLHGPITQAFLDEADRYQLRFQCEDCVYFNADTGACVHSYPNEPHRRTYFEDDPIGKVLIFCRDFELDEA